MKHFILGAIAVLLVGATARDVSGAQAVGTQFQVNTYTTGDQYNPWVAANAAGEFVVVWNSGDAYGPDQDGSGNGVFGQRYTSAGIPAGSEFQVNTYTTFSQAVPSAGIDASGNFVIVWQSSLQDGSAEGVFARRYDSSGSPVGAEFQVNTYTTNAQRLPAVAMDPSGSFVVAWRSDSGQDGDSDGIFGQLFDSAGSPDGTEFQVNTYTTGSQSRPAVAKDPAGNFLVVWESGFDVFGQSFDNSGAPVGSQFQINTYTPGMQRAAGVASDGAGNFLVAWRSSFQDGDLAGIFGQRVDSSGALLGSEFQINTFTLGEQDFPRVGSDAAGNFFVSWFVEEGPVTGVFGQKLTSAGAKAGAELQVDYAKGYAGLVSVAGTSADNFIVVWANETDGHGQGTFGQRYGATACSQTPQPSCKSGQFGKGALKMKRNAENPTKSNFSWKWAKGAFTDPSEFGNPVLTTSYAFCIYDGLGELVVAATAPASGACGTKPCWAPKGKEGKAGFKYNGKDKVGLPGGIAGITMQGGLDGKAKIVVKGKGMNIHPASLPLNQATPVKVQLVNSETPSNCWEAIYTNPPVKADAGKFFDKND